jgi:HlyD family secretion protein
MRRKRLLLTIAAVAGGAGLGTWALLHGQNGFQYRTAPVEKGEIAVTISATGNPNAVVTVQVGSQVSGNIMALYADFNSKVRKDQLIARIDPASFQARVDQAQANLDAARAAVINAQANVQRAQAGVQSAIAGQANAKAGVLKARVGAEDARVKRDRRVELAKQGVLSREDRDTAEATYNSSVAEQEAAAALERAAEDNVKAAQADVEVARTQAASVQAQVKQAAAALEQAQIDLNHTYIKAPVDGVVVSRQVDVGQTVAASLSAPTLFQIAQDLTKMQVDTNVSEADVGRVRVGQPATFTVDAYPRDVFRGSVTSIRQAPINVQNVITYDVVIGVSNPDLKLFPGMTANVKILVDKREDVLKVPNGALRFHPADAEAPRPTGDSGGRKGRGGPPQTVYVLDENNKPKRVTVSTGVTDGTYTEITSGDLQPGEQVIVAAFGKKEQRPATAGGQGGPGGRRGMGF